MAMIKGITVTLIGKEIAGKDPFGAPIFEDQEILVNNVLVSPTSAEDVINQLTITGKRAVYTLAIPKDDENVCEDQEVRFFGEKWRVFVIPLQGIDELIPLAWNKKVMVERYD